MSLEEFVYRCLVDTLHYNQVRLFYFLYRFLVDLFVSIIKICLIEIHSFKVCKLFGSLLNSKPFYIFLNLN